MSFLPGSTFQTTVPTTQLCTKNQTLRCFASYNREQSEKSSGSEAGISYKSGPASYAKGFRMVGDDVTAGWTTSIFAAAG